MPERLSFEALKSMVTLQEVERSEAMRGVATLLSAENRDGELLFEHHTEQKEVCRRPDRRSMTRPNRCENRLGSVS